MHLSFGKHSTRGDKSVEAKQTKIAQGQGYTNESAGNEQGGEVRANLSHSGLRGAPRSDR